MKTIVLVILGLLTWPAMEYILHRFLGHEWKLKTLFRREHQTHHAVKDFFAPAYYKFAAAVAVVGTLVFIIRVPLAYSVSFVCMYLFYEWTHYSFHTYPPKTRWGAKMRKHHFSHHFMNAKKNYGVTTALFDQWGGTNLDTAVVKVPRTFALNWLVDSELRIKPEYQKDYQI